MSTKVDYAFKSGYLESSLRTLAEKFPELRCWVESVLESAEQGAVASQKVIDALDATKQYVSKAEG